MNWKLINQPLGLSAFGGHDPARKHIIPAVIAAAAAIGSTIYGAAKSASENNKARAQLDSERAINAAERRRKMNESYLDTAAGQNIIRIARDQANKIYKQAAGEAAVAGATESSKQMAKDAGNQAMGNAIANVAAADAERKEKIDAGYRATDRQLAQQQIALDQQKGQNIAAAASQMGSSLMNFATQYAGTKIGAGSPAGGGVAPTQTGGTQLQNMGGGDYTNFSDYANNYVKNMYLPETYFTHKSPLFSTDYRQFFNLG